MNEVQSGKALLDKLGVKPGAKVAVLGVEDEDFLEQLRERSAEVDAGVVGRDYDLVFLATERVEELGRLTALQDCIKRNGAIWVVWPKGRKQLRLKDIIEAAKVQGLVDNKVVSFSDTHSAMRLVIPVARR